MKLYKQNVFVTWAQGPSGPMGPGPGLGRARALPESVLR